MIVAVGEMWTVVRSNSSVTEQAVGLSSPWFLQTVKPLAPEKMVRSPGMMVSSGAVKFFIRMGAASSSAARRNWNIS